MSKFERQFKNVAKNCEDILLGTHFKTSLSDYYSQHFKSVSKYIFQNDIRKCYII